MSTQNTNLAYFYSNQYMRNILLNECDKDIPTKSQNNPTDSAKRKIILDVKPLIKQFFEISHEPIHLSGQKLIKQIALQATGKFSTGMVEYAHTLLNRIILNAIRLQEVTYAILESVPADYPHKAEMHTCLKKRSADRSVTWNTKDSYSELCCSAWDRFYENPTTHKSLIRSGILGDVVAKYYGRWEHTLSDNFKNTITKTLDEIFFSVPKSFIYQHSLSLPSLDSSHEIVEDIQLQIIKRLRSHSPKEIARYRLVSRLWQDSLEEKNISQKLAQSLFYCLNNMYGEYEFSVPLTNLVLCLEQYAKTNSLDTHITLEQVGEFENNFSLYYHQKSQESVLWSYSQSNSLRKVFEAVQYDFKKITRFEPNLEISLTKDKKFTDTGLRYDSVLQYGHMCSREQFLRYVSVLKDISVFLDTILKPAPSPF